MEIPKVIYMTWKKNPPQKVFDRWNKLNPSYTIDFSLDHDCISFLKNNFGSKFSDLFNSIQEGMYKADFWRICKLYIHGGVYADIDIVPAVNLDDLTSLNTTFITCLSIVDKAFFQAFFITPPKNPLLYSFIVSFIQNSPYLLINGPCHDMYRALCLNLDNIKLVEDRIYSYEYVKIPIKLQPSDKNLIMVELPRNIPTNEILISAVNTAEKFKFNLVGTNLFIEKIDNGVEGWQKEVSIELKIKSQQRNLFLKECEPHKQKKLFSNKQAEIPSWCNCYILFKGEKILKSRDLDYYHKLW
jgi:hypothetical protein